MTHEQQEQQKQEEEKLVHPIRSIVVESRINRMGKGRKTFYATIPAHLSQQPLFIKAFEEGEMVDMDFDTDAQTITIRKRRQDDDTTSVITSKSNKKQNKKENA